MKKYLAGFMMAVLFFGLVGTVFAATENKQLSAVYSDIKVYVDQKLIEMKDANGNAVEPFVVDGTTYLPVRAVGEALGKQVTWDQATKSVYIGANSAEAYSSNLHQKIGETYSTRWFNFTIRSINTVSEYAGKEPAQGNEYIDVLISQTGTFETPSTMGIFDFHIDALEFDEYVYPMEPFDESMMPKSFELKKGETVEYHMIYEIPKDTVAPVILRYFALNEYLQKEGSFIFKLR